MNRSNTPVGRIAARFFPVALTLSALLVVAGCGGKKAGPGAGAAGGPAAPPPAQVTVVTVEPRTVPVPYELTGRIEGSREVYVLACASGILHSRSYEECQPIKKGQTL